jgi:flagellar biosynthesis/type III secretory pathway protein FliH
MAPLPRNEEDGLDELMELETGFYDEGYQAGVEDGTKAGLIEGKLFGIQKGYEKALEMGKLRGRAMVWNSRLSEAPQSVETNRDRKYDMTNVTTNLPRFENNDRLKRHVEALLQLVNGEELDPSNSDEAVAAFDELMVKARNKSKVISNITGEALDIPVATSTAAGIEDAHGLSARH